MLKQSSNVCFSSVSLFLSLFPSCSISISYIFSPWYSIYWSLSINLSNVYLDVYLSILSIPSVSLVVCLSIFCISASLSIILNICLPTINRSIQVKLAPNPELPDARGRKRGWSWEWVWAVLFMVISPAILVSLHTLCNKGII